MVAKLIGYVISIIGLAGFALTYDAVAKAINLPFLAGIGKTPLTIASLIIVAIGIFFIVKAGGSGTQAKEVPIYEGKKIVGFRRMGK